MLGVAELAGRDLSVPAMQSSSGMFLQPPRTIDMRGRSRQRRAHVVDMANFLCPGDDDSEADEPGQGYCASSSSSSWSCSSRVGSRRPQPKSKNAVVGLEFLGPAVAAAASGLQAAVQLRDVAHDLMQHRRHAALLASFILVDKDPYNDFFNSRPLPDATGWSPDLSIAAALKIITKVIAIIVLLVKTIKFWIKLLILFVKLLVKAIITVGKILAKAIVAFVKFTANAVLFFAKLIAKAAVGLAKMSAKAAIFAAKITAKAAVYAAKMSAKAAKWAAKAAKKGANALVQGAKFLVHATIAAAKMAARAVKAAYYAMKMLYDLLKAFWDALGMFTPGFCIMVISAAAAMIAASRIGKKRTRRASVQRAGRFSHEAATKAKLRGKSLLQKTKQALSPSIAKSKKAAAAASAGAGKMAAGVGATGKAAAVGAAAATGRAAAAAASTARAGTRAREKAELEEDEKEANEPSLPTAKAKKKAAAAAAAKPQADVVEQETQPSPALVKAEKDAATLPPKERAEVKAALEEEAHHPHPHTLDKNENARYVGGRTIGVGPPVSSQLQVEQVVPPQRPSHFLDQASKEVFVDPDVSVQSMPMAARYSRSMHTDFLSTSSDEVAAGQPSSVQGAGDLLGFQPPRGRRSMVSFIPDVAYMNPVFALFGSA